MSEQEKRYLAIPLRNLRALEVFADVMREKFYHAPVSTIQKEMTRKIGRDPTRIVSESEKTALRTKEPMNWIYREIVDNEIYGQPF